MSPIHRSTLKLINHNSCWSFYRRGTINNKLRFESIRSVMNSTSVTSLKKIASYSVHKEGSRPLSLIICMGFIEKFSYKPNPSKSAIVNAANEQCLGGGGVDGAISLAGGPELLKDRKELSVIKGAVRCNTGEARITGPAKYGELNTPYVIHCVGPNYFEYGGERTPIADELLAKTYINALERARDVKLEAVAFSLISSGIFRGNRTKFDVFQIGMKAICDYEPYEELKEIYLCALSHNDAYEIISIAATLGLKMDSHVTGGF